jgi:hypothetical protein
VSASRIDRNFWKRMSFLRRSAAILALAVAVLTPAPARAQPAPGCPSNGSEFWVVSTRGNAVQCDPYAPIDAFPVKEWVHGGWRPSSMAELLATSGRLPTIVYAHGNGLNEVEALETAFLLYDGLRGCAPCPFRFILWSWPAELPAKHLQERIQKHARQADYEGFAVARVVQQMIPGPPISISGHSLGSPITTSAMHHLGGGAIGIRSLGGPIPEFYDLRAALIAGALDNDLLLPGMRYDQALNRADRFLVFKNTEDKVLPMWPFFSERGMEAMGYTGAIVSPAMGDMLMRLEHVSTTPYVGSRHASPVYFRQPDILRILCCVFFSPRRFLPVYVEEPLHLELPVP